MTKTECKILKFGWRLALGTMTLALGLVVVPNAGWAQTPTLCLDAAQNLTRDTDGDGFTDAQECAGITTTRPDGTAGRTIPTCTAGMARSSCVDPNSKDLFVIYRPDSTFANFLPAEPFGPVTAYGINFTGLTALGVTVHQLTEAEAGADRTVVAGLPQKAVKVVASLDTNGTILGNCQWGSPNGLDGCVVYTQRARNFINSTCGTNPVYIPGNSTPVVNGLDEVFKAYMTYLVLHETGHSLGGLTADYNSRFGGYHYKAGAGVLMEQAVTYTVKGGKCTFYISPGWNALDAPAVKLK